jgi:galactosyl transferase GMA12/MNN10 family
MQRRLRIGGALVITLVAFLILFHRSMQYHMSHRSWVPAPCSIMERTCPKPDYPTLKMNDRDDHDMSQGQLNNANGNGTESTIVQTRWEASPSICIVTLTDEKKKSLVTRFFGWRNFDGLLDLTWDNKLQYATKHGHRLYDESDRVDPTRPPSWSKILAVRRLLTEEACDWVFWLDADTVIMNSNKSIEGFLPSSDSNPSTSSSIDLLITGDNGGGYNAGVWLIRNTPWSLAFLDRWWDMVSYVRPTGLSHSGDNDALKALLRSMEHDKTFAAHCASPPRCTFNSSAVFLTPSDYDKIIGTTMEYHEWYNSTNFYHQSDLIAHVAGIDNKRDTLEMLLKLAK